MWIQSDYIHTLFSVIQQNKFVLHQMLFTRTSINWKKKYSPILFFILRQVGWMFGLKVHRAETLLAQKENS